MKHYGDITKLSGYTLPVVDCITGGSPCQDLSVAGKREGLSGKRSGLFMEQVRIIKEMRERDRANGRTGVLVRPRYCVWENVPGAFSSNGGKDFQAVLTEFVRIAEPDAPDVPMPDDGRWPHAGFIYQKMGGWSVAWRTHDAQYWGVPQRRKRICVLADFNGLTAGEILFDPQLWGTAEDGEPLPFDRYSGAERRHEVQTKPESLSGDSAESGETRERTAASFESGADPASAGRTVCYGISGFDSNAMKSTNPHSGIYEADTARTLDLNGGSPACNQGGMAVVCYPETANTLPARMDGSPCIDRGPPIVVLASNQNHAPISEDGICPTLPAASVDCRNGKVNEEVNGTLQAKEQGQNLNSNNVILIWPEVRRLTPLECTRLQGFPDGWLDIGDWTDEKGKAHKDADSPKYKAAGNSIALPFWSWLARRICAQYERKITMGSLFDGIGGFPLVFERCGAKAVWASEIEEFPIAVTKKHFPEETQ